MTNSQGNRKIKTRKIAVTNNKLLVSTQLVIWTFSRNTGNCIKF